MGSIVNIELTPLKVIPNEKGNVMHALKCTESSFESFGEAYFSFVNYGETKGWKKHTKMKLNIIVPIGAIKFVLYDDREVSTTYGTFQEVILGLHNYQRLTVPPGIFMAFNGVNEGQNLLLNIASIPHDPTESENVELSQIEYSW